MSKAHIDHSATRRDIAHASACGRSSVVPPADDRLFSSLVIAAAITLTGALILLGLAYVLASRAAPEPEPETFGEPMLAVRPNPPDCDDVVDLYDCLTYGEAR